jgi:cytochrome c oxidase subunit 4
MSSGKGPHIVSPVIYLLVWLVLMVGTGLTVFAALQDFGVFNAVIALVIATTKAIFVILFFMHVKYSGKHIALVILSGLFFLAVLLTLTLSDYLSRAWVGQG